MIPRYFLGYSVAEHDIRIDTNDKTVKFRTSSKHGSIADNLSDLTDVDLTGLADGYFLRYNSTTSNWEPHEVAGGLASDWGSVADTTIYMMDILVMFGQLLQQLTQLIFLETFLYLII